MNSFYDKYRPTKISDLVGNKKGIQSVIKWIESIDSKDPKKRYSLLVIGPHGAGKSIAIEVILKHFKYSVKNISRYNLKEYKSVDDLVKKINSSNISDVLNKDKSEKFVLLIDEIESITSSSNRKQILELQKINDVGMYFPIIFISNGQHNKFLTSILKKSFKVNFYQPYHSDIYSLILKIVKSENLTINSEIIGQIITHSQYDIRRLLNVMYDIYEMGDISNEIESYKNTSKLKDIERNLYTSTKDLLFNYKNIEDCLSIFESETVKLPQQVHFYYLNKITNSTQFVKNNRSKKSLELACQLAESLSYGDLVENYIHSGQNWDIQEIHGYLTCAYPSYYLSLLKTVDVMPINQFAIDFNKTSIRNINKTKNIDVAAQIFKNKCIMDFIYMSALVNDYIIKYTSSDNSIKHIDECVNTILSKYDIEPEHVIALLKIDKVSQYESITSKVKKILTDKLKKPDKQ